MRTPCLLSRTLSEITGAQIYLKFENHQFTASFKERGALNKLLSLAIKPYKYVARVPGRQVHHLIEQRLWRQNPALRAIFRSVDDIPSVSLTPAEHQVFTNAWRAAFPYVNQAGHVAAPSAWSFWPKVPGGM